MDNNLFLTHVLEIKERLATMDAKLDQIPELKARLHEAENRIAALEQYKWKMIGIASTVSVVAGILWQLFVSYAK